MTKKQLKTSRPPWIYSIGTRKTKSASRRTWRTWNTKVHLCWNKLIQLVKTRRSKRRKANKINSTQCWHKTNATGKFKRCEKSVLKTSRSETNKLWLHPTSNNQPPINLLQANFWITHRRKENIQGSINIIQNRLTKEFLQIQILQPLSNSQARQLQAILI